MSLLAAAVLATSTPYSGGTSRSGGRRIRVGSVRIKKDFQICMLLLALVTIGAVLRDQVRQVVCARAWQGTLVEQIRPLLKGSRSTKEHSAVQAMRSADAVCFDVDSTVITSEGIDVLARHFGVYEEVANVTHAAMNGDLAFQDALAKRLDVIQPTRAGIQECLDTHRPQLSPGIKDLIQLLHSRGQDVYLVSGGFTVMIEPIADELGIARENIWANHIHFDSHGKYSGFDASAPTSRSGGKSEVVSFLKEKHSYDSLVMVGDGSTDMDARPPASAFIGYGGVQVRPKIQEGADWFVTSFDPVIDALNSAAK